MMLAKMIWIVVGLFFVQTVATAIDQKPIPGIKTNNLEAIVLQEIENMYDDSKHDGLYDYKFDSFKCFKSNNCILNFKMLEITDAYGMIEIYQSCAIKNSNDEVASVLDIHKSLKTNVYDQLFTCIRKKEVELLKL